MKDLGFFCFLFLKRGHKSLIYKEFDRIGKQQANAMPDVTASGYMSTGPSSPLKLLINLY